MMQILVQLKFYQPKNKSIALFIIPELFCGALTPATTDVSF